MKNKSRVIAYVSNIKCIGCGQQIKPGQSYEKQVSPDGFYSVYRHKPHCPKTASAAMRQAA